MPVSWLFVPFVPGLLMLATLGLGRLENSLKRDALHASDVAEFLEQAKPADVNTLVRDGMPEALDCFHKRRTQRPAPRIDAAPGASTRPYLYARNWRPNP